jgi:hypothetical protein
MWIDAGCVRSDDWLDIEAFGSPRNYTIRDDRIYMIQIGDDMTEQVRRTP